MNIDMAFMTYVAYARGLVSAEEKEQIIQCMRGLELPVWHRGCSWALVKRALTERLKHSGGQTRMPLPTGLGVAGTGGEGHQGPPGVGARGTVASQHTDLLENLLCNSAVTHFWCCAFLKVPINLSRHRILLVRLRSN